MIVRDVLQKTESHFKKLGFERPRFEAEMALSAALKWKRMDLFLKLDYPLQEQEIIVCRDYVSRRSKGEPLAYIENQKEFYGFKFYVDKNVLIPRPETEHMVDKALELIQLHGVQKFIDIGSGSGCIGISLLKTCETITGVAVDISENALLVTQKNAELHGVKERLTSLQSDFIHVQPDILTNVQLVVSNPPYIGEDDTNVQKEVREYEPAIALFAKNNGLELYALWIEKLAKWTEPNTHFLFEIGWQQKQDIMKIINDLQVFTDIQCIKDYSGKDRLMYFKKK